MTATDFGPKPELKWLPVSQLHVDHTYQRSIETRTSQRLIDRIAENFRWPLFGVATVTKGLTDFLILDGQHRTEAARRCGIQSVPCVVVATRGMSEQAQTFVAANRDRVAVSQYALFHALSAAGDKSARMIAEVCEEAGVTIPRYQIPAKAMKPGTTVALGAIKSMIASHGGAVSVAVLSTLVRALPEPGSLRAHIIVGLATVVRQRNDLRLSTIERAIKSTGSRQLERLVGERALDKGMTRGTAAAEVIIELAGGTLKPMAPPPKLQRSVDHSRRASAGNVADVPMRSSKESPSEYDQGANLTTAVQRRCQGCGVVFKTASIKQHSCEKCMKGRAA